MTDDEITNSSGDVFADLNVEFEPCAIQFDDCPRLELVLKDTLIIWESWGTEGVQIGYDRDGNVIGIQVPGNHTPKRLQ